MNNERLQTVYQSIDALILYTTSLNGDPSNKGGLDIDGTPPNLQLQFLATSFNFLDIDSLTPAQADALDERIGELENKLEERDIELARFADENKLFALHNKAYEYDDAPFCAFGSVNSHIKSGTTDYTKNYTGPAEPAF